MGLNWPSYRAGSSAKSIDDPVRRQEINYPGAAAQELRLRPWGKNSVRTHIRNIPRISGTCKAFRQLTKTLLVGLGGHLINWPPARRALTWIVQREDLSHV
jgi:hypothetical protein